MTKPIRINYLDADASARAVAILKDLLGMSGVLSVAEHCEEATPAFSPAAHRRFGITLSPTMMEVTVERDAFDLEGTSFRATEWIGHREGPLPRTLGEVAARLKLWIEDVACRSSSELIETFDRNRRKALSAAVAAALLKDETCFLTKVQRASSFEVVVEYSGDHSGGEYAAGGIAAGRSGATMSPELYDALGSFPYHVSITGTHHHLRHDVDLAFWGPEMLIFDERLPVTEKLRLIALADDAGFSLID